jgi:hypothetical protein
MNNDEVLQRYLYYVNDYGNPADAEWDAPSPDVSVAPYSRTPSGSRSPEFRRQQQMAEERFSPVPPNQRSMNQMDLPIQPGSSDPRYWIQEYIKESTPMPGQRHPGISYEGRFSAAESPGIVEGSPGLSPIEGRARESVHMESPLPMPGRVLASPSPENPLRGTSVVYNQSPIQPQPNETERQRQEDNAQLRRAPESAPFRSSVTREFMEGPARGPAYIPPSATSPARTPIEERTEGGIRMGHPTRISPMERREESNLLPPAQMMEPIDRFASAPRKALWNRQLEGAHVRFEGVEAYDSARRARAFPGEEGLEGNLRRGEDVLNPYTPNNVNVSAPYTAVPPTTTFTSPIAEQIAATYFNPAITGATKYLAMMSAGDTAQRIQNGATAAAARTERINTAAQPSGSIKTQSLDPMDWITLRNISKGARDIYLPGPTLEEKKKAIENGRKRPNTKSHPSGPIRSKSLYQRRLAEIEARLRASLEKRAKHRHKYHDKRKTSTWPYYKLL